MTQTFAQRILSTEGAVERIAKKRSLNFELVQEEYRIASQLDEIKQKGQARTEEDLAQEKELNGQLIAIQQRIEAIMQSNRAAKGRT